MGLQKPQYLGRTGDNLDAAATRRLPLHFVFLGGDREVGIFHEAERAPRRTLIWHLPHLFLQCGLFHPYCGK